MTVYYEVSVDVTVIEDGETGKNKSTTPIFWFVDEDEAHAYAGTLVNFLSATQGVDDVDPDGVFI